MKYVKTDGRNRNVLVLLHGTGGDAESLFGLADYLDPEAAKLGIQGEVSENGMNRYFVRRADGSFDLESLAAATARLHETLQRLLSEFNWEDRRIILAGYSNGANIAQNLLKEYRTNYDLAILLHPSPVRPEAPFRKQTKLKALITYGDSDPFLSEDDFEAIERSIQAADIPTTVIRHTRGHSIIQGELDAARKLIRELDETEA